jgi:hypothetical protein
VTFVDGCFRFELQYKNRFSHFVCAPLRACTNLRKSAVLRDLAARFLISLDNFSILSSDLVVGTKFPWLGLVSCSLDFITHRDFSFVRASDLVSCSSVLLT